MTLEAAIKKFQKERPNYRIPSEVRGYCLDISDEFLQFLGNCPVHLKAKPGIATYCAQQKQHYPLPVQWAKKYPPTFGGCRYHCVVKIGKLRIDWTARQFDPQAPVPLIWRTK